MKKNLAKASYLLSILLLTAVFLSLGKWQLNRASEWKELKAQEKIVDQRVYELRDIALPSDTLTNKQTYKSVQAVGHYIATFKAPNQPDASGRARDWEVSLLEINGKDGILVVRGLWSERLQEPQLAMSQEVTVVGKLQPRQSDDRAVYSDGSLQRIDSALITSTAPNLNIYDGFIAASSEEVSGTSIDRTRITPPFRSAVTGYYWQHISYVMIWWLMAVLTLYLPLYNRRISQPGK